MRIKHYRGEQYRSLEFWGGPYKSLTVEWRKNPAASGVTFELDDNDGRLVEFHLDPHYMRVMGKLLVWAADRVDT